MLALLTALALLTGEPSRAIAQLSGSDPTALAAGLKLYEDGQKAMGANDFEAALKAFQQSLSILPSPNTRYNVARCFRALGRTASAYTNFRLAAREAADRVAAARETRFAATRDAAEKEAAALEPKVPRLNVIVPSDAPPGLTVTIDGQELPRSLWNTAVETDPGVHVVAATGPRIVPFEDKLDLAEGSRHEIKVTVRRVPTAHLVAALKSRPSGFSLELDGKPLTPSDLDGKRELDAGPHRIVARAPGYRDFVWNESLRDGQVATVEITFQPIPGARGGPPKPVFYGAVAASAATLGVGTAFAIHASGLAGEETDKPPLLRDPRLQKDVESASARANAFFITGAVLGVGAGVLFFLTDWTDGAEGDRKLDGAQAQPARGTAISLVSVAPWAAAGAGGIAAGGIW
ncbi:uncharacterized protein SOCE26_051340 [Sorangium cellulosum]|uniref:PEGA domain-containing protein n=1 Tax=Sorangium cellulosum TaxID=56 RepID=A0A2L0EWL0_SORCE|nr:hypothetical protein [Sorangium cellulosum]AUX43682.1 uncharacterized protein SOCE26_051340 [Sorangium cellulosum]